MSPLSFRIGVDIGGTFTDIVALGSDGRLLTHKRPSTPPTFGEAIRDGVRELLGTAGIRREAITDIVHATTVATNAVLEMRGARTALVTTEGFRDVLEMRRLRIPEMYNLQYDKPPPLIPRRLRFEVAERTGPDGAIWRPLDRSSLVNMMDRIAEQDIEAVAIAFLHAYANDTHERIVEEALRDRLGLDVYIARSSAILPEAREYERTSTTVVSAYIGPVVQQYLGQLGEQLETIGLNAPLRIMQSNGGALSADGAIASPAHILESGPAAGVIACARAAAQAGIADAISLDMGGTTAKAAIIENGEPARTTEYEVGAGINLSSKLVKGGGYAVKLPFIDVSEIGAGGGSIVALGPERTLQVGPRSAGAVPGPVCYNKGGTEPTFTDAVVVLGYLNPRWLAGGTLAIDADKARQALTEKIAEPLDTPVMDVAFGIYMLAAATMTRAVKAVSTYRGRDPRDFVLFAFGGNGPVAAAAVASDLGIRRVLVPPAPGVFSAFGLPFTNIEHEVIRTVNIRCGHSPADIDAILAELKEQGYGALAADGFADDRMRFARYADMRYAGQAYELTVPLADSATGAGDLVRLFNAEHERTYGHRSESDPVDIVNLKLTAIGLVDEPPPLRRPEMASTKHHSSRYAYFGADHGAIETAVLARESLCETWIDGPVIVEEYDSTCVVPPGARVRSDAFANIEIVF